MSNVTFESLVELAATLRGPNGCPWDKEQTYETVAPMTIEEAYETLEAIEKQDTEGLRHELGDLLFHVVFYSQMAKEQGQFTIDDVISHVYHKLVHRHPHVFGDVDASTPDEVLRNWEAIKAAERAKRSPEQPLSILQGVSTKLPALIESFQLTERASRVGFDWSEARQVVEKIDEEVRELKERLDEPWSNKEEIKEEIGDLLFVVANLARLLDVDPELALRSANHKFRRRFRHIEVELHRRGRTLEKSTLEEMDELWEDAKRSEAARGEP
jgi:MazG family protein